ncbi:hypothetical protein M413DRAFT_440392 [Hebeloma cylindrosporum]|uniref:RING-type domain-containing protein n=1 Tax=Hebeloma cylindrosporum TaxID=76867 RepID=A0A0C2YAF7_HEBCY|nr:hypothetical protein M413DRAFT_440392 [Hebeloma cylindrosporum h7]
MPRSGEATGYDAMHVCAFCIEYLTITAAGRNQLKAMNLGKLKRYINAYNIGIDRAVEKDDLIDAIVMARGANGCVSRANENFYRKYSVPNKALPGRPRGLFSRPGQSSNQPPPPPPRPPTGPVHEFPRPDLAPDDPPPSQAPPPPTYPPHPPPRPTGQHNFNAPPPPPPPRPHSAYSYVPPHNPPPQFHTPPPRPPPPGMDQPYWGGYDPRSYPGPQAQAPPPPPHHSRPQPQASPRPSYPPRPRPATQRPPASEPPAPPPRPRAVSTAPPPNLSQLINMSPESIASLSISALKSILFINHVNVGQILEKSDLVSKVMTLIQDEKAERERQRQAEEREEMELMQRELERREAVRQRALEREAADAATSRETGGDQAQQGGDNETPAQHSDDPRSGASPVPSPPPKSLVPPPKVQGSASTLERTGLCVVCQDEEANIAIVDCGHMAMCRGCSDLIMASSRECPLCRTRIVTEARLLRIFRT